MSREYTPEMVTDATRKANHLFSAMAGITNPKKTILEVIKGFTLIWGIKIVSKKRIIVLTIKEKNPKVIALKGNDSTVSTGLRTNIMIVKDTPAIAYA